METDYKFSNLSDINIYFSINENPNKEKNINIVGKESYKKTLPKNKIFKLSSLFYNYEQKCNQLVSIYYCIYEERQNSLFLIINKNDDYSKFTKERMIYFLEFSIKIGIDIIFLLVDKDNKKYKNIIQDMKIVGFKPDKKPLSLKIDGKVYKKLRMPVKGIFKEIVEIHLI